MALLPLTNMKVVGKEGGKGVSCSDVQLFTDPKSMNDLLNTHGLCDISDEMIESFNR